MWLTIKIDLIPRPCINRLGRQADAIIDFSTAIEINSYNTIVYNNRCK